VEAGFSKTADDRVTRGFAFLEFSELRIADDGTAAGTTCYNKCQYCEQNDAYDFYLVNDVAENGNTAKSAALLRRMVRTLVS
jgi:hypothetical protein